MKTLFEMPELLTLSGNPFDFYAAGTTSAGFGCAGGCTGGCATGCESGTGKGVAPIDKVQ